MRDSHPILNAIDYDHDDALILTGAYFATDQPVRYDHGTTYANAHTRLVKATTYEWRTRSPRSSSPSSTQD